MAAPLIAHPLVRDDVRTWIDSRLRGYQQQIVDAQARHDKAAEKIGRLLQDELLDVRNALIGRRARA